MRVTVQVLEALGLRVVGVQVRADTRTGATKLNEALWEAPFKVAVTAADWVVVIVPTVALKVADVLLAGTVADAGTVSAALLLESPTILPPVGAAWLRVTAHVVEVPELMLDGLQVRVETRVGATRLNTAR